MSAIVLTSLIVPSTFETCAMATIFVLSLIVALMSSRLSSPSSVIGINFNDAFYVELIVAMEQYSHGVPSQLQQFHRLLQRLHLHNYVQQY